MATTVFRVDVSSAEKGSANGIATLDGSGLVPSNQLPSYVDDVQEYSSTSAFPATGEIGKIYVATDTNKSYRWSGSTYVELSSYALASDSAAGLMSATDKAKLDGIAADATLPAVSGSDNGKVLTVSSGEWSADEVPTFTGVVAQGSRITPGTKGLVPAPTYPDRILRSDGTWGAYPVNATTSNRGTVVLSDNLGSTSTTEALTANAGNTLYRYIEALTESIAIIAEGNAHIAIPAGYYVFVLSHPTLSNGLYKNKTSSAIAENAELSTSNLETATGYANTIMGKTSSLSEQIGTLNSKMIKTDTVSGTTSSGGNLSPNKTTSNAHIIGGYSSTGASIIPWASNAGTWYLRAVNEVSGKMEVVANTSMTITYNYIDI